MSRFENNLVVIGAGSAGLITSLVGATAMAKVVLVERAAMGGDCLNTGCVPSKALIASAKAMQHLRDAEAFGLREVSGTVDFQAVMARVHDVIDTIAPKDSVERYESLGVRCAQGEARLLDGHSVQVDDRVIDARSIVLATGAEPVVPPIPGLAQANPLTSENLWEIRELPRRLLVLGGGPIGCELAQAFHRLGSDVTVVDMEPRLLPREDPDASDHVAGVFAREGISVLTGHRAAQVENGVLSAEPVQAASGASTAEVPFDRVLVAVGRRARTAGFGLEEAGVACNPDGTVQVDKHLRTTLGSVYACGDVVGPYQFTHMAAHQAWYAGVNALARPFWRFAVNYDVVPWATYTDPEVARVGLSETQAADAGIEVDVTRYELDDLDRGQSDGTTSGFVKLITKRGSDRLLGALIVGPDAGEMISGYVGAMTHGLGLKKLLSTIHIYPTRSEAVKMAAGQWRRANVPRGLLALAGRLNAFLR